jgi:hypothetical protein
VSALGLARGLFVPFACGALFAVGLGLSGMTDPRKIIGFLDLLGDWDPSLAFVMAGALAVHVPFYRWFSRRPSFAITGTCGPTTERPVDRSLLAGAAIFGAGWGLGGFCPGPAIVSLVTLAPDVLVFASAMLVGMATHAGLRQWSSATRARASKSYSPSVL